MDTLQLGHSGIEIAPLGVGAMSWANRSVMSYGGADSPQEEARALEECLAAGVTLVDTAEAYGRGRSERRVGELARAHREVIVATKYAPYPFRRASSLPEALDRSLQRLGRIDLYQLHWPPRFVSIPSLLRLFAAARADGRIGAVGVSNFDAAQLRAAHAELARADVPLASNQVQYSLLCYPEGGIVDDLTLYRLADDHYMLTVNASNIDKDWDWVTAHGKGAEWKNVSAETITSRR